MGFMEELQDLIVEVSTLIGQYDKNVWDFPDACNTWLERAERILEARRHPTVASLSTMRGKLISARRGIRPDGARSAERLGRRELSGLNVQMLSNANEFLQEIVRPLAEKHKQAKELARQIVAVADQQGLIEPYIRSPSASESMAEILWQSLLQTAEINPPLKRLLLIVEMRDAQHILWQEFQTWIQETQTGGMPLMLEGEAPASDPPSTGLIQIYRDRRGQFRWRLRNPKNQIIATSGEGHNRKSVCLNEVVQLQQALRHPTIEVLVDS